MQRMNKHKLKTQETRKLLLRSAEKIFARDGYEAADLGEIASMAERTKGAIYAHFKGKEDLFLAIFEERTARMGEQLMKRIGVPGSASHNLDVLKDFCLNLLDDSQWLRLLLEFKLYACRNRKSKKRLQTLYAVFYPSDENAYAQLYGFAKAETAPLKRSSAIVLLLPILSALAVEEQFAPNLLEEGVNRRVVSRLFDALMG